MTDEKLQALIGNLLRIGVFASATVIAIAGMFYLIQHHADRVHYSMFEMERPNLRALPGIFNSAMRLRTDAVIQFGLVLLIATPICRVGFAAVGFFLQRDHLYVAVSLIVLAFLVLSLTHAR